jgi:hypothetical protein
VVAAAPRLDPRLVSAVFALDDAKQPFAATWRSVGVRADELGLPRPGYETVRLLARLHRRRRGELDRLLAPVLANLLSGRMTVNDLDRLLEASELARDERKNVRRQG